ncbi:hypothetical protein FKP32DRAFT_1672846 [Trametes sanguinea]|nr:hypothetical protein FKP32DRAFT_1672846 [Trametes sanguinea]
MSSVPAIDLRRALAIVERMKAENVEIAKKIYNATLQFMETQGFSTREDQWFGKMENLVRNMHFFHGLTTSRRLQTALWDVHGKGGFAGLRQKALTAIEKESKIGGTFRALLDLCHARVNELSPSQRRMFYDTFPVIHRILLRAKDAEIATLRFLKANHSAIVFMKYAYDNFEAISVPLRLIGDDSLPRHTQQSLDIVGTLLDEAATLTSETVDEAAAAAAQLRSLGSRELEQAVVDQKLTGLVNMRNKLDELQESKARRFESFLAAVSSPAGLPATLRGPADVEFSIAAVLNVADGFAHFWQRLETTHQFLEAQTMINLLLQATSWSV